MEEIDHLSQLLHEAGRILIFTGAGISTNSGIPDFRGPGGVWSHRKPVYYQDFMTCETARTEHWDYKLESWEAFRDAQPNAIHKAIVALEWADKLLKVVTQNIDGLHQKAGTSRELLIELHGTNTEVECQSCGKRSAPDSHFEEFRQTGKPPLCECGGYLKQATISFGQNLRPEDIRASEEAAHETDLVIAMGSTLSVYPAASVPLMAAQRGVPYVVINRGPTEHDNDPLVKLRVEGDVGDIFPAAVANALATESH